MKHRPLPLLLLAALPALADRPLVSETADVIGRDSCQVEAGAARTSASGLQSARSGDALFSCGLPANSQAGLGYTRATSAGASIDAVRLVGKTTLLAPEPGRTGWGLAYGVGAEKSVSWRIESLGVLAVATRELASGLLGHANLGWSRSRADQQSTTTWSLGLETTSDLTLAADVFGDDRNPATFSAGLGYAFGGGFSANLSYALLLDSPRARQVTLGAKFAF